MPVDCAPSGCSGPASDPSPARVLRPHFSDPITRVRFPFPTEPYRSPRRRRAFYPVLLSFGLAVHSSVVGLHTVCPRLGRGGVRTVEIIFVQ